MSFDVESCVERWGVTHSSRQYGAVFLRQWLLHRTTACGRWMLRAGVR